MRTSCGDLLYAWTSRWSMLAYAVAREYSWVPEEYGGSARRSNMEDALVLAQGSVVCFTADAIEMLQSIVFG